MFSAAETFSGTIDAARCIPLPCFGSAAGPSPDAADWRKTSFPLSNPRKLPGAIPSFSTLIGADCAPELAFTDLVATELSGTEALPGAFVSEAAGTDAVLKLLAGCARAAV